MGPGRAPFTKDRTSPSSHGIESVALPPKPLEIARGDCQNRVQRLQYAIQIQPRPVEHLFSFSSPWLLGAALWKYLSFCRCFLPEGRCDIGRRAAGFATGRQIW